MRRFILVVSVLALALPTATACSSDGEKTPPTDPDGTQAGAIPLSEGADHSGSLNPTGGDTSDWLRYTAPLEGMVNVVLRFPSMRGHNVTGVVEAWGSDGKVRQRKAISPGTTSFVIEWPSQGGSQWMLHVRADKGASSYTLSASTRSLSQPPPREAGNDQCKVFSANHVPKGTRIMINRGSNQGVAMGQKVIIGGLGSFKVFKVMPDRTQAILMGKKLAEAQLATAKNATCTVQ